MSDYNQVIGVLGGMGPKATASFYDKIIKATEVKKDQDHFRTIIDSNPKIPDRTQAILNNGPSPVEEMKRTAKNLIKAGATVLVMPCVTAHYFYDDVQNRLPIPFYHVIEGTKRHINLYYPKVKKLGILATTGTRDSQLFQAFFEEKEVVFPDDDDQKGKVMEAIYGEKGIKQGNTGDYPRQLLKEAADDLINQKECQLIIGGCTEIELALSKKDIAVPFIDPMEIAADNLTTSLKGSSNRSTI